MSVQIPNLDSYDIKVLFSLLNNTKDADTQDEIKKIIINKINDNRYPLFYYINKFKSSIGFIKEIYADLILMNLNEDTLNLVTDEVLQHVSLDALINYGTSYNNHILTKRCKDEFYRRGIMLEDKTELSRKKKHSRKISFVVVK